MTAVDQNHPRRVIVMGASNVTLGLPTIVECARSGITGPLKLEIADGHGRSYGKWTSIPFRSVPGHSICSVPPELDPSTPTYAVLSDIGNDLVYGITPEQTSQWVREVAERLATAGVEIVMTGLPLASVHRLSRARFNFFRTIFFPGSPLQFQGLVEKVEELNAAVRAIAADVDARVVELDGSWYGLDPIHFRRSRRKFAWSRIFSEWTDWQECPSGSPGFSISLIRKIQLWRSKPQEYRSFGKSREHERTIFLDQETEIRFF